VDYFFGDFWHRALGHPEPDSDRVEEGGWHTASDPDGLSRDAQLVAHPIKDVLLGLSQPRLLAALRLLDVGIGAHPTPGNGHVVLAVIHFR
jgi:hypothetical protein